MRRDDYNYYPSNNPLADLGPSNLQTSSIAQHRTLTNCGMHSDISYAKGINKVKAGAQYEQTFLRENDKLGIVEAIYNSPCVDASGDPSAGVFQHVAMRGVTGCCRIRITWRCWLRYDLTRGGSFYGFTGHTDMKEACAVRRGPDHGGQLAVQSRHSRRYLQRTHERDAGEPRLGVSYNVKPTGTVLRVSYARTLETPFNENLVLSSNGCRMRCWRRCSIARPGVSDTLAPGFRNEFHAGLQQALGKNVIFSGEYIWKYTHNAFDFSVLGNTPITFPIDWHNSKIPGYALHVEVPNFHSFSA